VFVANFAPRTHARLLLLASFCGSACSEEKDLVRFAADASVAEVTDATPMARASDASVNTATADAAAQDSSLDAAAAFVPADVCLQDHEFPIECANSTGFNAYSYENGECARHDHCIEPNLHQIFSTREECLALCEGRPVPRACPAGTERRSICFGCLLDRGCTRRDACATPCIDDSPCTMLDLSCVGGFCQVPGCE
jgi:hypothetical protein